MNNNNIKFTEFSKKNIPKNIIRFKNNNLAVNGRFCVPKLPYFPLRHL